eukprot:6642057-Lingulodinium_polyedra.AAC.1
MQRARVRFSSRCGGRPSTRPHHCARFQKPCDMIRSNRPSAVATARTSHAHRLHANTDSHGERTCD